jgi:hypothetical protein
MYPQCYGQFLLCLTRSLGPHVQVQAVLTVGSLIAITPLRGIEAWIVYGLVARMAKLVTHFDAVPRLYRLWFTPTQVTDRCCGIGNAFKDIHVGALCPHTLNLTALYGQYGTQCIFITARASHQ